MTIENNHVNQYAKNMSNLSPIQFTDRIQSRIPPTELTALSFTIFVAIPLS